MPTRRTDARFSLATERTDTGNYLYDIWDKALEIEEGQAIPKYGPAVGTLKLLLSQSSCHTNNIAIDGAWLVAEGIKIELFVGQKGAENGDHVAVFPPVPLHCWPKRKSPSSNGFVATENPVTIIVSLSDHNCDEGNWAALPQTFFDLGIKELGLAYRTLVSMQYKGADGKIFRILIQQNVFHYRELKRVIFAETLIQDLMCTDGTLAKVFDGPYRYNFTQGVSPAVQDFLASNEED
ncbi:unnamed protein product [Zymoseptoria tritici ST99CH_3D1]|nr:unnamed protein product [Zymoseptoria tritici ST99CH_3D1]